MQLCVLGQESSVGQAGTVRMDRILCVCADHTQMVWTDRNVMSVFVWLLRHSWVHVRPNNGPCRENSELSFTLGWLSSAGCQRQCPFSSSLQQPPRRIFLDSKMKARHKKNSTAFLYLLYAPAFKINFRTGSNNLEVWLCDFFFFKVAISSVYIM